MQNGNRKEYRYYYQEVLQFAVWKSHGQTLFFEKSTVGLQLRNVNHHDPDPIQTFHMANQNLLC